MAEEIIDLDSWPRAQAFRWFRGFERPHYAVTVRLDATRLMEARKPAGTSLFRAGLHAIGCGLHSVPELCMRFRGETVVRHDRVMLSTPVPRPGGSFNFAYVPFAPDFDRFDAGAQRALEEARHRETLTGRLEGQDGVAYMSCLPWLDFTALDNAMPHADGCIPRVCWGKIVPEGAGWRMAMSLQVHHALVDGAHLGQFFAAAQTALDGLDG